MEYKGRYNIFNQNLIETYPVDKKLKKVSIDLSVENYSKYPIHNNKIKKSFEPSTTRLKAQHSTTELRRHVLIV